MNCESLCILNILKSQGFLNIIQYECLLAFINKITIFKIKCQSLVNFYKNGLIIRKHTTPCKNYLKIVIILY
uniref:Uncharacterized protein n=1 Tax=Heterorhabditis bacteriophora TaxID=37862 RepID=A0A1I7WGS9_HETBA